MLSHGGTKPSGSIGTGGSKRDPDLSMRARAMGWFGMRRATVVRPAVVSWGTTPDFFNMMVRGRAKGLNQGMSFRRHLQNQGFYILRL